MQTVSRSAKKTRTPRVANPAEVKECKSALKSIGEDDMILLDGEFTSDGKARSHAALYRAALKNEGVHVRATSVPNETNDSFRAALYNA